MKLRQSRMKIASCGRSLRPCHAALAFPLYLNWNFKWISLIRFKMQTTAVTYGYRCTRAVAVDLNKFNAFEIFLQHKIIANFFTALIACQMKLLVFYSARHQLDGKRGR